MQARISVITLAVLDLEASLRFYRDGLGFPSEGIMGEEFEYGAVAFIQLQSGLKLALWPQRSIQQDTGLEPSPICPTQMTLGHNVYSPLEVDQAMAQAERAGAKLLNLHTRLLWRICRLFSGSQWSSLGNCLEPGL